MGETNSNHWQNRAKFKVKKNEIECENDRILSLSSSEKDENYHNELKTRLDEYEYILELFNKHIPANLELGVETHFHGKVKGVVQTNSFNLHQLPERSLDGIDIEYKIILMDKNNNVIDIKHDVGTGVSQVLPCIGAGIFNDNQATDNLIIIEQPELHLHPDQQCSLADAFIIRALSETTFFEKDKYILETHSEHLLLRIQRRLRESFNNIRNKDFNNYPNINSDSFKIYFIENNESNGSTIKNLALTQEGELVEDWPDGFFDQSYK